MGCMTALMVFLKSLMSVTPMMATLCFFSLATLPPSPSTRRSQFMWAESGHFSVVRSNGRRCSRMNWYRSAGISVLKKPSSVKAGICNTTFDFTIMFLRKEKIKFKYPLPAAAASRSVCAAPGATSSSRRPNRPRDQTRAPRAPTCL